MIKRYFIGNTGLSAVNLTVVLDIMHQLAERQPLGYICLADAGVCYAAGRDEALNSLLNRSFLTLTSSSTIAKIGKKKGFRNCGPVYGAQLLHNLLLTSAMHGHTHFFYGKHSAELRQLKDYVKNSYMGIRIAGTAVRGSLPVTEEADALAESLNESQPAFFWCGLPSPQQEELLATLQPKLTGTTCIGAGNAFKVLAEAGLTLPDPGKRTLPGESRFLALKLKSRSVRQPLPVLLWLLKMRLQALFSGNKAKSGKRSRKSGSKKA